VPDKKSHAEGSKIIVYNVLMSVIFSFEYLTVTMPTSWWQIGLLDLFMLHSMTDIPIYIMFLFVFFTSSSKGNVGSIYVYCGNVRNLFLTWKFYEYA